MAKVYTPPTNVSFNFDAPSLFLAGSIGMDKVERWQDKLITELSDLTVQICNPRRADYNPDWVQSKDNPDFAKQVNWELNHILHTSHVVFYFAKDSLAPITFFEFGKILSKQSYSGCNRQKIFVYCPEGFWRKGNVEVICQRDGVKLYTNYNEFLNDLRASLSPVIAKSYTVFKDEWIETERGWGTRLDGFSIHLSRKDYDDYVAAHWTSLPQQTPDIYIYPCNRLTELELSLTPCEHEKLVSKKGIYIPK